VQQAELATRVGRGGLIVAAREAKLKSGEAQLQASMHALNGLREELNRLGLLDDPFRFPSIVGTLTGM
jgi:hypothetical protein